MSHKQALIEVLAIVKTIPGHCLGSHAEDIFAVTEQLADPDCTFAGAPPFESRLKESAEDTARLDWLSEYIGSDPVNVTHIKVNAPLMTLRSSIDGWMRAAIDAARGVKP